MSDKKKKKFLKMDAKARAVAMPLRKKGMTDEEYEEKLNAAVEKVSKYSVEVANEGFDTVVAELGDSRGWIIRGTKVVEDGELGVLVDGKMLSSSGSVDGLLGILETLAKASGGKVLSLPLPGVAPGANFPPAVKELAKVIAEVGASISPFVPSDAETIQKISAESVAKFIKSHNSEVVNQAIAFFESEAKKEEEQKAKTGHSGCGSPGCPCGEVSFIPAILKELKKQTALNVH